VATETIDHKSEDVADCIRELTGGRGRTASSTWTSRPPPSCWRTSRRTRSRRIGPPATPTPLDKEPCGNPRPGQVSRSGS
jgi:hypothetical protein